MMVRVEAENNPELWSEVVFVPADWSYRLQHQVQILRDKACIWWDKQMDKRLHHQLKKIKIEKDYDQMF